MTEVAWIQYISAPQLILRSCSSICLKVFGLGTPHQLLYPKIKWINPAITLTVCGKIITGVMNTTNLLWYVLHGVILPKWAGNDWKKSYLLKILLTDVWNEIVSWCRRPIFSSKIKNWFSSTYQMILIFFAKSFFYSSDGLPTSAPRHFYDFAYILKIYILNLWKYKSLYIKSNRKDLKFEINEIAIEWLLWNWESYEIQKLRPLRWARCAYGLKLKFK